MEPALKKNMMPEFTKSVPKTTGAPAIKDGIRVQSHELKQRGNE